jgi:AraC-like DNA-binding protein
MLQVYPPPTDLARWVDAGVVIRLGPAPGVSRFPAMPQAMLTLQVVHLAGGAGSRCVLGPVRFHTASTEPVAHGHGGAITALGLIVRPAAAACLLGAAGGVLVDHVLSWRSLVGDAEADRLDEALQHAGSDPARLLALQESLRRAMAAVALGRDEVYARLCAAVGETGAAAGEALGLGRRQLERRCHAVLGLSPKRFQRLVRLQQALALALAAGPSRLAAVAAESGYYDQSHLARDARELVGAPLASLPAQAQPGRAWWPLAVRPQARLAPLTGASAPFA